MLAFLQRDEPDWQKFLLLLIFFGLPLVARLVRWLAVKAGLVQPAPEPGEREARRAGQRQQREAQRRSEEDGEDLWRRLARGEVSAPPRAPPTPAPLIPSIEAAADEVAADEVSLELEQEPAPLSVLGEVSEPADVSPTSLESEAEPEPLAVLSAPAALAPEPPPAELPRRGFVLARGDLRRGVLLAEILGPPVSERQLRA